MKIIKAINSVILALCIKIAFKLLLWMANIISSNYDFYETISLVNNFYSVYLDGIVNVLVIAALINFFIILYNHSEQFFADDLGVSPETSGKM